MLHKGNRCSAYLFDRPANRFCIAPDDCGLGSGGNFGCNLLTILVMVTGNEKAIGATGQRAIAIDEASALFD
jgi:hypothetical protein